jgi:hypothetical protein
LGIYSHKGNYRAGISRVRVLAAAGGANGRGGQEEHVNFQLRCQSDIPVGSGLHSEWRGLTGTISGKWGNPEYLALDVQLEDGRTQLFWHHELEEI